MHVIKSQMNLEHTIEWGLIEVNIQPPDSIPEEALCAVSIILIPHIHSRWGTGCSQHKYKKNGTKGFSEPIVNSKDQDAVKAMLTSKYLKR